jgi:hypothetical protein
MRFERRVQGQSAEPALGLWFGGALLAAAALATVWFHLALPRPLCRFREWTGFPCPTCGSTRMVEALLSGQVLEAVAWNPLVFLGLCAVALWAAVSVARVSFGLPAWRLVLAPRERLGLRLIAVVVLAAGWAYLIWRGV